MSAKSNKIGVVQLTILTMVNMMGSGIIMLPTKLAEIGTISIVSWLVTAVGSTALAYAFAQCGMFSRKSGGMGGYAEYSFGKAGNFMANYTYGVSLVIANTAIAISAVGYGSEFLGATLSPLSIALWTIFTLWLATVLNFGGARITGNISSFTIWGVIIPVVGISIIGWKWFDGSMVMSCFGSLLGWQFTIAQVFKSSAEEGYFPAFFKKVTSKDAPIVGMVTITALQTLLSLMTISPSLNKQFNVLVDLAVVTNVIPYLLSMAALPVLLKTENVPYQKYKKTVLVAFIGSVYSIYALYAAGEQAMLYGSIVTFIGWTLYGFVSYKFDLKKYQAN